MTTILEREELWWLSSKTQSHDEYHMQGKVGAEGEKFFISISKEKDLNQNVIRGGVDGHPDLTSGGP